MSARRYTKADVQMHSDGYRSARPAVNVKVYGSMTETDVRNANESGDPRFTLGWIEEHLSEETRDRYFWAACEGGFEDAQNDAEWIFEGYTVKVWAEGRSGGWAVVDGLPDIEEWDAVLLAKWRKFERHAQSIRDVIFESMASVIHINRFEQWADEQDDPKRLASSRGSVCEHCLCAVSA